MKKTIIILGTLLVVSCTKIVETETVLPSDDIITIPYSVTVSSDETRATVGEDLMTLKYAEGDQLYISCDSRDDISGLLQLKSGAGTTGEKGGVTFTGTLSYSEQAGAPADNLYINATLVGNQNRGIKIENGKVTGIEYPTYNQVCTDVYEAVEQYSYLTGVGTFGNHLFQLSQHTAFLSFAVKATDNPNVDYTVYLSNGGNSYRLGSMKSGSQQQNYEIRFALPVPEGTVLENASITLVKGTDFSGTPASRYTASFGGKDPKTLSPKVYLVTKTALENTGLVETGLPIIEINTNDPTHGTSYIAQHKDEEQPSWMTIHVGKRTFEPAINKTEGKNCSIKGRGNTTWNWKKKPYKVKLEQKTALLKEMGLTDVTAESKHWVLLANFMDRTMMRNMVAMELSSMMTNLAWTPHCIPVELYINGVHQGNYLLIEQVRVEEGRVVVAPKNAVGENANDVGFMMELDFHYDNYYGDVQYDNTTQWRSPYGRSKYTGSALDFRDDYPKTTTITTPYSGDRTVTMGIPFSIKEPDWSPKQGETPVNSDQLTYIKDFVSSAGASLFSKGTVNNWWYNVTAPNPDQETGYPKYLDVESFIDYWIVFELMINHELGNPGSVYMTKPKGGKLTAGPCWDFDWGTLSSSYNNNRWPKPNTNLMNADAIWYESLMKDYSYVNQLYNRFLALKSQLQTIPAKIDEWEQEMAVSAELNFKMWKPSEAGINGDENLSYHEAVARIKQFYTARLSFVETKLSALRTSLAPETNN